MAAELFARMMADPPKLTSGALLADFLRDRYHVAAGRVDIMLREYLRFLALAATQPEMTVPSPLIDTIWHHHIEDTRAYQAYCERLIGKFVHHTPNLKKQSKHPAYTVTLKAYTLAYGQEPHSKVWPDGKTLRTTEVIWNLFAFGFVLCFFGVVAIDLFDTITVLLVGGIFLFVAIVVARVYAPWSLAKHTSGGCGGDSSGDGGGCGGD